MLILQESERVKLKLNLIWDEHPSVTVDCKHLPEKTHETELECTRACLSMLEHA